MDIIFVESPTKARTLSRFLGKSYRVEATMGHIRDLPKAELGVDVDHGFVPSYVIPRDKQKRVRELKNLALSAENVILATDPDREGEAIAWHVASILNLKPKSAKRKTDKPAVVHKRIVFHEITEAAIKEALKSPRTVDMRLVDAQQARRVLDRLVGYKLSPLLWYKLSRRWLSAGRVQSVAVRLIVEREREITAFAKTEFYTIETVFETRNGPLETQLVSKAGQKYEQTLAFELFDGKYTTAKTTIAERQDADRIIADFAKPFTVGAVDRKEIRRSPPPPYTTSTLQQDAGRRYYFSAKKTMQVAQKLYEEGFITYHRTDSFNLSDKFTGEARDYISKTFGSEYAVDTPRVYRTKSKVAQEAHEAIRPTDLTRTTLGGDKDLNRDHERVYEMIWKRALSTQAKDAIFDSTTIVIRSANAYQFQTQGSVVKFEGYLKITGRENGEEIIPPVTVGQELQLKSAEAEQHFTSPPPRYSEATLIKTLEEKEIGRPSTYAPIISTIIDRNYVEKQEKKLIPTELGNTVTDFLVKYFQGILSLPFTANMEASLDAIANGDKEWVPVIREFYEPFAKSLDETYKTAQKVKIAEEEINEMCPKCGSQLVVRMGKFGKFVACSTYPKCDYTRQLVEKIDMKCPRCGGDIIVKKSRRGKMFYGCGNYPKCNFAAWKKEDIK